uniref:C3H1-type domain-containing protein n=1 Tax=Noctiluca scintillans TaxID=2966 RepID=A0A7S1B2S4_NOCSC
MADVGLSWPSNADAGASVGVETGNLSDCFSSDPQRPSRAESMASESTIAALGGCPRSQRFSRLHSLTLPVKNTFVDLPESDISDGEDIERAVQSAPVADFRDFRGRGHKRSQRNALHAWGVDLTPAEAIDVVALLSECADTEIFSTKSLDGEESEAGFHEDVEFTTQWLERCDELFAGARDGYEEPFRGVSNKIPEAHRVPREHREGFSDAFELPRIGVNHVSDRQQAAWEKSNRLFADSLGQDGFADILQPRHVSPSGSHINVQPTWGEHHVDSLFSGEDGYTEQLEQTSVGSPRKVAERMHIGWDRCDKIYPWQQKPEPFGLAFEQSFTRSPNFCDREKPAFERCHEIFPETRLFNSKCGLHLANLFQRPPSDASNDSPKSADSSVAVANEMKAKVSFDKDFQSPPQQQHPMGLWDAPAKARVNAEVPVEQERPQPEEEERFETAGADASSALGSPEYPTVGSAGHSTGQCKPCAFIWKETGCNRGIACPFCHLCDSRERRRRAKERMNSVKLCRRMTEGPSITIMPRHTGHGIS